MVKESEKSKANSTSSVEWILEAIRKVRNQKQKTDLERITLAIQQCHKMTKEEISQQMEMAVKSGSVAMHMSNTGASYRDPNSSPVLKTKAIDLSKKQDIIKIMIQSIEENGSSKGLMLKSIEKAIVNDYDIKESQIGGLATTLRVCLHKAIQRGELMQSGKFIKICDAENSKSSDLENANFEAILPFERNKKMAKPFIICSFCCEGSDKNREGKPEEMVSCADCGASGHPSCLQFSAHLTATVKKLRWQCMNCKKCSFCGKSKKEDDLLLCDFCDRGFHNSCCDPPVLKMPKGDWKCNLCDPDRGSGKGREFLKSALQYTKSVKSQFKSQLKSHIQVASRLKLKKAKMFKAKKKIERTGRQKKTPTKRRNKIDNKNESDDENKSDKLLSQSAVKVRAGMVLPTYVTEEDIELFKEAQERTQKDLFKGVPRSEVLPNSWESSVQSMQGDSEVTPAQDVVAPRYPPCIEMGKYEVDTWYSSPYPQEYASLPKLYICEYCLRYMKTRSSLERHFVKCKIRQPPADEIYRHENLSVFEVDGNASKLYCQNLCLLAKLFLDHKTLYYDVEPFLFYVLTYNDEYGSHIVGYFSKEKHCQKKYNVSCIMTMPQYMRKGYGRLLIDFSYLLTRKEEITGSPEKPLSALGAVSYQAYWKSVIIEFLDKNNDKTVTVEEIGSQTGLSPVDILQTLHKINFLQQQDDKTVIAVNQEVINSHMDKLKAKPRLSLNEDRLQWTPTVNKTFLNEAEQDVDRQLIEMREAVDSVVADNKESNVELKSSFKEEKPISLCSPIATTDDDQTDKWPRRYGRKRFPSMTWGSPVLKRHRQEVSNDDFKKECSFDFGEDGNMPPPTHPLRPLKIDRSPMRSSVSSSPLSPISPSPFRPSNDSPVKTPDKKSPRKFSPLESEHAGESEDTPVRTKRRGRPPKNSSPGVSSGTKHTPLKRMLKEKVISNDVEKTPSRRGRPVKRKPGRPRKNFSNENSEVSAKKVSKPYTKVPGRRPGRPRKNPLPFEETKTKLLTDEKKASLDESDKDTGFENDKDSEEDIKEQRAESPTSVSHKSVSPAPTKKKEDDGDSSSSSDNSDSSSSDSSDSDEENDGDDESDEDEQAKKSPKPDSKPKPVFPELKPKVRRLSASSSDEDEPSQKSASAGKKVRRKSDDSDKQNSINNNNKLFSDSGSDSDDDHAFKLPEIKDNEDEEKDDRNDLNTERREEDEETKAASQNLADLLGNEEPVERPTSPMSRDKDIEQPDSVRSDAAPSLSLSSIDEFSDLSNGPASTAHQIPSSPPPAPAPVVMNSDDDDEEIISPSPTRSPPLSHSHEKRIDTSSDPLLSSPSQHQQQQLLQKQQNQHPPQIMTNPQVMVSSSASNVPHPQLSPLAHKNIPSTSMVPASPIFVSASPQTMPRPSPQQLTQPGSVPEMQHDEPYRQSVGSAHSAAPLPSPVQLTSPAQMTSPAQLTSPAQHPSPVQLTSPGHLTSPQQMASPQIMHVPDKHLSPMDTSPVGMSQKPGSSGAMNIPQSRAGKSRTQQRQRSQPSLQHHSMSLSFPTGGPPPLSSIQPLHQQNFDLSVGPLGLDNAGLENAPLNFDCAQNMQYSNQMNSFMDTVKMGGPSQLHSQSSTTNPSYLNASSSSSVNYHHQNSPISTYSPSMLPPQSHPSQQQPQQQQTQRHRQAQQQSPHQNTAVQSSRIAHNATPVPMLVQQAVLQGASPHPSQGNQPNNCDLIKLQQLTNRIQDLEGLQIPSQNMTPPPINMTPPPPVMMRSMTTPPIPPVHLPTTTIMGQPTAPPYKRQRSSNTSSTSRKTPSVPPTVNPNVTVNPSMTLSPNVTIQPGGLPRYINYRMPQGMLNPSYITNTHSFLQPQQLPMQVPMMNMNVHPAGQAAFQQQVQQAQQGNVYPYYFNMNNVMRR